MTIDEARDKYLNLMESIDSKDIYINNIDEDTFTEVYYSSLDYLLERLRAEIIQEVYHNTTFDVEDGLHNTNNLNVLLGAMNELITLMEKEESWKLRDAVNDSQELTKEMSKLEKFKAIGVS